MNDMTLPSRRRIRNVNPGGLRPNSLLNLVHRGSPQYLVLAFGCAWPANPQIPGVDSRVEDLNPIALLGKYHYLGVSL